MGETSETFGQARVQRRLGDLIEQEVVASHLESYIDDAIGRVQSMDDLVAFLHRFTQYNQPFPAGVCHLAALVHLRNDVFRDESAAITETQDRSAIIASNLLFAVEDEYASPDRSVRLTHRQMAQEVLAISIELAGWTLDRYAGLTLRSQTDIVRMRDELLRGYRLGPEVADQELFAAIGFHLGSERLADIEFNALNRLLRTSFPEFVAAAQRQVDGFNVPAYLWIDAHTSVEVDHFAFGVVGAAQAIEWYCGAELDHAGRWAAIMSGFSEFVKFQRLMFSWLDEGPIDS